MGKTDIALHMIDEHQAVMVDSGFEEKPEFYEYLSKNDISVRAVILTHTHIDHIANNKKLHELYGTEIITTKIDYEESKFWKRSMNYPLTFINPGDDVLIEGQRFKTIHTPGHSKGHILVVLPDGICCVGDAFIPIWTLRVAKMPYVMDLAQDLKTLEMIRTLPYETYMMSHFGVIEREFLAAHVDANIDKYTSDLDLMESLATEKMTGEELALRFLENVGIKRERAMNNDDYMFTANARVQCLIDQKRITEKDGLVSRI